MNVQSKKKYIYILIAFILLLVVVFINRDVN